MFGERIIHAFEAVKDAFDDLRASFFPGFFREVDFPRAATGAQPARFAGRHSEPLQFNAKCSSVPDNVSKSPADDKSVRRAVTKAQLRAGVRLQTGRSFVLIVDAETRTEAPPNPDVTPSVRASFDAAHFETAKALPLPPSLPIFRGIAAYSRQDPSRPLLIVGHTDAVGSAESNLMLSDDRAQACAAFLKADAGAWMRFYAHPQKSHQWGVREDQIMLSALPFGGTPYFAGPIDGIAGRQTDDSLRKLQNNQGLTANGKPDNQTRAALINEYMAAEGTRVEAGTSIQTLACGKRHLEVNTQSANAQNRRVDVFAFDTAPIKPLPADCRNGTHPGCTVYEAWKKEVKGPIPVGGDNPPPKAGSVLKGKITYRDGTPAAGVPLIVELPDGSKKGGTTDAGGNYRIEGVEGSAKLRLVDGLSLAEDPAHPGQQVVAVNGGGAGGAAGETGTAVA